MDYRHEFLNLHSRKHLDLIVNTVLEEPGNFSAIYRLIYDKEDGVAWHAAWACEKICKTHPEWFSKHKTDELIMLCMNHKRSGIRRLCLSMLLCLPISEKLPVEFINTCFEWIVSANQPTAVQALSMKFIFEFCKIEPDFKQELKATLENIDTGNYTVGFLSTRKNILKKL